ncbi:hypothetical protein [Candidatus Ichthyocystis hellenicum]|uniref:hypothetical protein n=1 Tax=Candidatus Ichthyocystis hellenicum TaxID=1561003 RepID=UPI0011119849|nr:hypothetical protein [Candidatus Ichthyocystis hellenicum]
MSYINSKYLNHSQDCILESKYDDEVVAEAECTVIIPKEKVKSHRTTSSLLSRSISNGFVTAPLIILTMLGNANGSKINSVAYHHCELSSAICGLISVNESESRINDSIRLSNLVSTHKRPSSFISQSLPLIISSENKYSRQLSTMARLVQFCYLNLLKRSGISKIETTDYSFCRENVISNFCDGEYNRNTTISDRCCPNIGSYIKDLIRATTPSTTMDSTEMDPTTLASAEVTADKSEIIKLTTLTSEVINSTVTELTTFNSTEVMLTTPYTTLNPEIVNSTTITSEVINSTITKSTIFGTTETRTINEGLTMFVVVLVAFLYIAVAILSFMGYRRCSQKKVQQHQHVSHHDDTNEEVEDLV